jgi:LDH2 family malate/lactate/ureidoglycolate dehydrogenase
VLALHIAAFEDVAKFKSRVDGIIRQIHASRTAPGVDRILVPGERAAEAEKRARAEGVVLAPATRKALAGIARRLGADASLVEAESA